MDQRTFEMYFDDESGLLCTWDGSTWDGGDSAQKTGLYRFGRYLKFKNNKEQLGREQGKFAQECDMLESHDKRGWYIRSPSLGRKWWNSPYTFSRDQHRSVIMAMGALGQKARLRKIFWEHIKRGFFYQNRLKEDLVTKNFPDVTAPDHLGELIRAMYMAGDKWLVIMWPLMLLTDLSALVGLLFSFINWKNPDEADDDNMIMSYLQAKYSLPTPISYLVRKIYKHFRPIAGYTDETKTRSLRSMYDHDQRVLLNLGPISAIKWKHRVAMGAPPFEQLYKDILTKEL